jgi:hypothetical protein
VQSKPNSQGLGFGNIDAGILRVGYGDSANDQAAPWQIHGTPDLDFGAQRPLRGVADALLDAARLQVEIDTKEDDSGQSDEPGYYKKKSLGKNEHSGKLRNFSGM